MTLRRSVLVIIVAVAALVAGILIFPADKTAAVTRLLDDGEAAIEHADLDRIDKLISLYYKDDLGFTYASMRGNFSYVFKQYENIAISRTTDTIVIGRDSCIARVTLWIRGNWFGKTSDIVGTETAYEPVEIHCVREFFRWKVIGTHWPNNGAGIQSVLERRM